MDMTTAAWGRTGTVRTTEEATLKAMEFRVMADNAMREAEKMSSPATRDEFLKIAREWLQMAMEVERISN
jgi:hypothetical protein